MLVLACMAGTAGLECIPPGANDENVLGFIPAKPPDPSEDQKPGDGDTDTEPATPGETVEVTDPEMPADNTSAPPDFPVNAAPTIEAGPDHVAMWPANQIQLSGTVSDDGLPDGQALTVHWSLASGPGEVVFSAQNTANPTVTFDRPGEYTLTLRATDGELTGEDSLKVVILPEVEFTVALVFGMQGSEITCKAITPGGENLPEGTYTWQIDGTRRSGPKSTHAECVTVIEGGGLHTITLALTPPSISQSISCRDSVSGTYTAEVVVYPIVSGQVVDKQGKGIPGVTLTELNGNGSLITDSSGSFAFPVAYGWSGTIVIEHEGMTFDPPSLVLDQVVADRNYGIRQVVGQIVIGGRVTVGGVGLPGTVLVGLPGNPVADSQGYYTALVNEGWSGTVVPARPGYSFTPPSRTYSGVTTDRAGDHYTGSAGGPIISGKLTPMETSGNPAPLGVTGLLFEGSGSWPDYTVLTDTYGHYSQPVASGWRGTIRAADPDHLLLLAPAGERVITAPITDAGLPAQDFIVWKAPIGMPAPTFGIAEITPAWPAVWPNTPAPGNYYIDNTHTNATDEGNPYGTPNRPRATFPSMMWDLGPGSLVEIHGGPYSRMSWVRHVAGSPSAPAFIRGTDPDRKVKITGGMRLEDVEYLIIENIDWDGNFDGGQGGGIRVIGENNQLCIRHCEFQDVEAVGATSAIGITPPNGGTIQNVVVFDNVFHDCGDWQREDDVDSHGVAPNLWGRDKTAELKNLWVIDNEFYHMSGNGVQINAGNWTDSYKYLHHVYVGRNVAYANRQAGFWTKQASDVIFSQNLSYSNRAHGPQPGDGFGCQYNPDRVWFIFNETYDCNYGFRQSDTSGGDVNRTLFYVGNIIHNITPEAGSDYSPTHAWRRGVAISLWHGSQTRYIVNNTIYNCAGGIVSIYQGPVDCANNIIASVWPEDRHYSAGQSAGVTRLTDTLMYQPGGLVRIEWSGLHMGLSAFVAAVSNQGQGCIETAPLFVNAGGGDFRLRTTAGGFAANSAAHNAGTEHPVYDWFESYYPGESIRFDFYGNPRPTGSSGWDMGATEQ